MDQPSREPDPDPDLWCPSARPDQLGAVAFGVRTDGAADEPRVGYLARAVPVDEELLALAEPVSPLEVFRFAAPCARGGCVHFESGTCHLAERIVEQVPVAVSIAPPCAVRSRCKWWAQEGAAACRRCPLVVTRESGSSRAVAQAAQPPVELLPPAS